MLLTLEQERAKHAWAQAENCSDKFKNLAKGAPAIIMNNGLMPSLAFWQSKNEEHHKKLVRAILSWLTQRTLVTSTDFKIAMNNLQNADSTSFMKVTNETLEYLKWLRNFASAISKE